MLTAAIIGFGPHGKRLYQAVQKIGELKLTGIVDKNEKAFEKNPELTAIKFNNTQDLYKNKVDVVLISTNGPSHHALAIEAMNNNVKYILVEKPMACSVKECIEMIETAKQKNVRLAADKNNRYDPVHQWFRKLIEEKKLGELRSIYFQKPGIGIGGVGTHYFDLANYFVDDFPEYVSGWIDEQKSKNPRGAEFIDPGGLVVMTYKNGVRAMIDQIEDGAGPQLTIMNFTDGRIVHDPKYASLDVKAKDPNVIPKPGVYRAYEQMEIPSEFDLKGNMLQQLEDVIKDLISDKEILSDAKFGMKAVEILSAAYISNENNHTAVKLPLTKKEDLEMYHLIT